MDDGWMDEWVGGYMMHQWMNGWVGGWSDG